MTGENLPGGRTVQQAPDIRQIQLLGLDDLQVILTRAGAGLSHAQWLIGLVYPRRSCQGLRLIGCSTWQNVPPQVASPLALRIAAARTGAFIGRPSKRGVPWSA